MNRKRRIVRLAYHLVCLVTLAGFLTGLAQPLAVEAAPPAVPEASSTASRPALQGSSPLQPVVSHSIRNDTSLPLRDIPPLPPTADTGVREIPLGVLPKAGEAKPDGALPSGRDPALQERPGGGGMPPPAFNFEGVDNVNGVLPPDTNGDVGPSHYVQWVNLSFAIWSINRATSTATLVYGPADGNTLWAGFGGPCQTTNDGDPIALYDTSANRWLMSQFALPNFPNGPFYQCIAISQSNDPTGAWHRYQFLISNTKLNDYPKFGVWPDAYYMAINQFTAPGLSFGGQGAVAFERDQMLNGLPADMIYFDLFGVNPNFGGMLPSDLDGITLPPPGAPNYFVEMDDDAFGWPTDRLSLWEFHVDWVTPANSTFGLSGNPNVVLNTAPFDSNMCGFSRNCIPQPGTAQRLDAISDRLMYRLAYRNMGGHETLVTNHTVDVDGTDHAGVRWYEVRKTDGTWAIFQQGTYAPDAHHRWMGSLAMDHNGNMALGYSVSSGSVFPSIRYDGRLAGDPLGTLPQGEATLIAGSGSQTHSAARWGDYSMMGIDPLDDCTFWYTQEYYAVTSSAGWQTRIGSFKFPSCSIGPQGTLTGVVTDSVTSNPVASALVQATSSPTQTFGTTTNPSGGYTMVLPSSTYTVTAARYGYVANSISGASIVSGTTTTVNLPLTPTPSYVISGFVTDSGSGQPLLGTLNVVGSPFNPPTTTVQTDPNTGYYSMALAGGQSYTFTVSALLHVTQTAGLGVLGSDLTQNFALTTTFTNGGIIGYIRDYYTSAPVPGAQVSVVGTTTVATTNAQGYFQFLGLAPGFYTATASAYLYSSVTVTNIQVFTGTAAYREFLLPASQMSHAPQALAKTLTLGTTGADNPGLVITNTGIRALDFALVEGPGGFLPSQPAQTNGGGPDPFGYTWKTSLEAGGPPFLWIDATGGTALNPTDDSEHNITLPFPFPFYTATATALRVGNNGAALYNATTGEVPFSNVALTSTAPNNLIAPFWDDIDSETGNVYWMVVGSAPNRKLVVEWFNRPHFNNVGSATFEMVLFEDGDILYQYLDVNFGNPSYDNGASATVGIRGGSATYSLQYSHNTPSLQDNFAICFDNPTGVGACGGPGAFTDNISWLTESPITGTLPGGVTTSAGISLTWSAAVAEVTQPGVYTGTLRLFNNDPNAQNVSLPVAMTVTAPATWGRVTGAVTGLTHCDQPGAPLQGATVYLQSGTGYTRTLATNASGVYSHWLDQANSPLTLTVSNSGYQTQVIPGIMVTGSTTTTQNVDLRLLVPCASASSQVTNVQPPNALVSRTLTINNSGAFSLTWSINDQPLRPIPGSPVSDYGVEKAQTKGWATFSTNPNPVLESFGGRPPLAPADSISITHSASQTVLPGNSVSCSAGGIHTDNSYLRVFDLPTFGILGSFDVTSVDIGIELANDGGGAGQPLTVNLYALSGPFVFANLTLIGTASYTITDQALTIANLPVTGSAPPGSKLVGEIFTPDGSVGGHSFFIGSNNLGETAPSYLAAAACGVPEPTPTAALGFPNMHIVMNVYGDTGLGCVGDLPWLSVPTRLGTTAPDSSRNVNVVFDTSGMSGGVYTGTLCINSNDPVTPTIQVPVILTVGNYGVASSPAAAAQSGAPGTTVTYTLRVTNTGTVTDQFDVIVSGNTWTTSAPATVGPLAAGASTTIQVTVNVPAGAGVSASDAATITFRSQGDNTQTAVASLTTTSLGHKLYLPIIFR